MTAPVQPAVFKFKLAGTLNRYKGAYSVNHVNMKQSLPSPQVLLQYYCMRTELVTTLKRQATEILNQLEKDREPILITQHGVPSAYLVDVETFETLQRRMTLLEGIARGEKAIEEGRSLTQKQAKQRMSRWLK